MENEKRKYWFFGSKLNTALLFILIILMVIALKWMYQNKKVYMPIISENKVQIQPNQKVETSWVLSPTEFGTVVSYPSNWQITPQRYSSPAEQAAGIDYLVGYGFMLPSNAIVTWGGAQGGCSLNEFGEFKYGVSTVTCLKGYRLSIGRQSAREVLSQSDLKLFGDFVLKNQ